MMKKLLVIVCVLAPFLLRAQVRHLGEVELLEFDGTYATIQAEGIADKKNETATAAMCLVFEKLFYTGVDGLNNGEIIVTVALTAQNKYYFDKFFEGKNAAMNRFVSGSELLGKVEKDESGGYKALYTIVVKYKALLEDLELNKLRSSPEAKRHTIIQEQKKELGKDVLLVTKDGIGPIKMGNPHSSVPQSLSPLYDSTSPLPDTFSWIYCKKGEEDVLFLLGEDYDSDKYETLVYFILQSPAAQTPEGLCVGATCEQIVGKGGKMHKKDDEGGGNPTYYVELNGLYFFFDDRTAIENGRIKPTAPSKMISNCNHPFFA